LGYSYCPNGSPWPCATGNTGAPSQQTIAINGTPQATQEYLHDSLNRLVTVGERAGGASFSAACPDSSSVWRRQFSYDNLSNRVVSGSTNVQSIPWDVATFNSNNQITDSGWGYDLNGNITQSPASPQRIVYDAENRMVSFCSSQDGHGNCTALMQYVYDGLGNRVQRISTTGAGTVATTYAYDAFGDLAAEYGGNPVASAGTTEYLTADALGSTRLVMAGIQFERHDYQPFGYEIPYNYPSNNWRTSVPGYGVDTVRQKFTGQERDTESSLDFFQARYFSGAQGRFASPDPANAGANPLDPQSWNGYAYVSNNPLMYTDPDGQGIFGDIGSVIGSFFPGLGSLVGWGIGTIGDIITGQPISPPGGLGLFLGGLIPTPGGFDPSLGGLGGLIGGNNNPLILDQQSSSQSPAATAAVPSAPCLANVRSFVSAHTADATTLAKQLPGGVTPHEVLTVSAGETVYGSSIISSGNYFGLRGTAYSGEILPPDLLKVTTGKKSQIISLPRFPSATGFLLSGQVFVNTERPFLQTAGASNPATFFQANPRAFFQTIHEHGYGTGTPNYVDKILVDLPKNNYSPFSLVGACLAH